MSRRASTVRKDKTPLLEGLRVYAHKKDCNKKRPNTQAKEDSNGKQLYASDAEVDIMGHAGMLQAGTGLPLGHLRRNL